MKKLFKALICVAMLTGCSSTPSNNGNGGNQQEEPKKTDLEIVSEVLTLETGKTSQGSTEGLAMDGETKKFKVWISLNGMEKNMAEHFQITPGMLFFFCDEIGNEVYNVDKGDVHVTYSEKTAESMKEEMDNYLKEKGITIEQVRNAMNEKFGLK